MKHALLITAYKDFDILIKMLDFYKDYFDCYIHIDKKSKGYYQLVNYAEKTNNIFVFRKYKINWGSYKHISAILYLLKVARTKDKYDFFHIISANTFLSKPIDDFYNFFEANSNKNFIDTQPVESDYIANRYKYHHYLHVYNYASVFGKKLDTLLVLMQRILRISPKRIFRYKGYVYCHINDEFAKYVIESIEDNKMYLDSLKTCNVPEEFFFQNIIMNSDYQKNLINDSLIFNIWQGNAPNPELLSVNDLSMILDSNSFFARKIEDLELLDSIIESIGDNNG